MNYQEALDFVKEYEEKENITIQELAKLQLAVSIIENNKIEIAKNVIESPERKAYIEAEKKFHNSEHHLKMERADDEFTEAKSILMTNIEKYKNARLNDWYNNRTKDYEAGHIQLRNELHIPQEDLLVAFLGEKKLWNLLSLNKKVLGKLNQDAFDIIGIPPMAASYKDKPIPTIASDLSEFLEDDQSKSDTE